MKQVAPMMVMIAVAGTAFAAGSETKAEQEGQGKIALFNGEDFSGLKRFLVDDNVDPGAVWQVKDGVIHCTGDPMGYLRTRAQYGNYRLRFEWRWPKSGGNSGVLIHIQKPDKKWPKSIEGQMQHEHAGDFWVIDGTDFKEHTSAVSRRVLKQEASSEKNLGEWNEYVVECKDDTIKLYVNGVLQNAATECTVTEGYIGWQSEGTPIQLRNLTLKPLKP